MATNLEGLQAIKAALITKRQGVIENAKDKPTYSIDGQSVSWTEYASSITKEIEMYNALIQAERPFMVVSRGRS